MLCSDRLHAKQKKDITCRNVAVLSHGKNRSSFNPVNISADGTLQKQQYIYGLKHDVIIAPCPVISLPLHETHSSEDHQGAIFTFHINRCDISDKNLPNMAKYPQKHLQIPQVPLALLAMDTIGHLSVMFRGH